MTTSDRRLAVLRAIVIEYVNTGEMVSSKAVATSHVTGVSSATIRNDMGVLENQGLIQQPHTSAGRIPTEAGYRLFVDSLQDRRPLQEQVQRQVEAALGAVDDYEDAITRTVRLLSQLTRQAAVVEYPDFSMSTIRQIELIDLGQSRVLVLVVSGAGVVIERHVDLSESAGDKAGDKEAADSSGLLLLRNRLNEVLADLPSQQAPGVLASLQVSYPPQQRGIVGQITDAIEDCLKPLAASRIITAGGANLARSGIEFSDVATVLETLEDQVSLLRVLKEVHTEPVQVSIGAENQHEPLFEASLVSAIYAAPSARATHIGVIGPTRMDYARSLAAVEAVSCYLGRLLLKQFGAALDETEVTEEESFDGNQKGLQSDLKDEVE